MGGRAAGGLERWRSRTFFVENNIDSPRLVKPLLAEGFALEQHRNHLHPACGDAEWIRLCASRGWVGLTTDRLLKGRGREHERNIVLESGAVVVLLPRALPEGHAAFLVNTKLQLDKRLHHYAAPLILRITSACGVEFVAPEKPVTRQESFRAKNERDRQA